jgi:hypothetical protein
VASRALISCWAYSSTLKLETICSSETSDDTQRTTLRNIPEDRTLIIDVKYVLKLFHRVVVGDVAEVSEVHAASIFRVDVCRLVSCFVYMSL